MRIGVQKPPAEDLPPDRLTNSLHNAVHVEAHRGALDRRTVRHAYRAIDVLHREHAACAEGRVDLGDVHASAPVGRIDMLPVVVAQRPRPCPPESNQTEQAAHPMNGGKRQPIPRAIAQYERPDTHQVAPLVHEVGLPLDLLGDVRGGKGQREVELALVESREDAERKQVPESVSSNVWPLDFDRELVAGAQDRAVDLCYALLFIIIIIGGGLLGG
jgi:hypothetical protein